jgi:hypothetical protein
MSVSPQPLSGMSIDLNNLRRKDRTQKLKDARSEAAKEIEEYKRSKEEEFKAFQGAVRTNLTPLRYYHTNLLHERSARAA